MSPREKKLLVFFGIAGFIILNFLGFTFYNSKRLDVKNKRAEAERKLAAAEMFRASREQVTEEMTWLAEHEPEPAADQNVKTTLQQFVEAEAKSAGLTIKTQQPQQTVADGKYFHRARFDITVSGPEDALYKWFDRLNVPAQFRIATSILLSPNREDDTKIDCKATIEQWFVPMPPA